MSKLRLVQGAGRTQAFAPATRSLVLNGELIIYGVIDPYVSNDFETTVRAIDVMASLVELADSKTIVVRINSPGGSVVEGLAIYNLLRNARKRIEVHVDAAAYSIASIIAMAGDTVIMSETASIMAHDPWGVAVGRSEDMRRNADEIDRLKGILVGIYADKTGLERAEIEALMTAETYLSAADAVEAGFADKIENALQIAAYVPLPSEVLARLIRSPAGSSPRPRATAPRAASIADVTRILMRMRMRTAGMKL